MFGRTMMFAVLALGSACALPLSSHAQRACNSGPSPDVTPAEVAFATELQRAVKANDRNWVADHVEYPLHYFINDKTRHIKTRAAFLKAYDKLFIYDVTYAIEKTDVHCLQKPEDNDVMMGDGQLWFHDVNREGATEHRLLIESIHTADQGR